MSQERPKLKMQNIPKIVREQLNAAMPVGHHPDADVLTAFAERSLPEVERTVVLEHLARCGGCRDVLALALPESEAAQTVIAPARGGWLTWPALRWGFVAAGSVAIVSLGILQYQRHLRSATMVARQTTSTQAVATNVQPQPASPASAALSEKQAKSAAEAVSSPDTLSAGRAGSESNQLKLIAPAEAPQVSVQQYPSPGGIGGGVAPRQLLHGPAMPTQWQQQQVARVQASPAPTPSAGAMKQSIDLTASKKIPPTSQMVQVEASSPAPINAEAQNRSLIQDQDSQIQAQSNQPQPEFDYPSGGIGKAKPAAGVQAANAASGQAMGGLVVQQNLNGLTSTQLSQAAAVLPRWSISPTGGLQRSFDQGQTWQDVDVNASSAPATSATSLALVAKTAPAKDAVANRKVLKGQSGVLIFRTVTTIGPEVWAGGSNGALYHSLDAGNHWNQVLPSAEGAALTGDIVGLEFPDAQHGQIKTSTVEVWITSDGGQTWQKQ